MGNFQSRWNLYLLTYMLVLATCSEDKRIGFIDTEGKVAHVIKKAHSAQINRCEFVDEHIFMSGDDDG